MPTPIRQTQLSRSYWPPTRKLCWAVIQTDDPDYMPASSREVRDLAEMMRRVRDEIGSNAVRSPRPPSAHKPGTGSTRLDSSQARFSRLEAAWRQETQFCSTLLEIVTNPNYQQIIGMGRCAVPYILAELAREPGHWFWALKAITTEDPVADTDRGNLERMTQTWLIWGARNGYEF